MSKTIRIVSYAVNGSGVGHVTRQVALARWLRRYGALAGHSVEIWFLTTSEADGLLFSEGFASFKMPSKTSVSGAGINRPAYLALAKQWVWHSLGLLRPDLLIVDTFPQGSFGELLSALDLCKTRAFVYRPTKEAFAARADFQAMLPLYDAILVPEHEANVAAASVIVPATARERVTYTGPVFLRDRAEAMPKAEARRVLGVPSDALSVYVSAGGGGDAHAEHALHATIDALEGDRSLHLVVAAGPLYRGRPRYGPRMSWVTSSSMGEMLAACDVAISAAGYNAFHELMHAGVPTVFVPQEKVADDQRARAESAVRSGAAIVVASPEEAAAALDPWREATSRASASEAARALVPRNYARDMAAELLRLVVPGYEVDAAHEVLDDATLAVMRSLGVPLEVLVSVMHAVEPRGRAMPGAARTTLVRDLAVELLRFSHAAGIDPRALEPLARRLPLGDPAARARAVREMVGGAPEAAS